MKAPKSPEDVALRRINKALGLVSPASARVRLLAFFAHRYSNVAADELYRLARRLEWLDKEGKR